MQIKILLMSTWLCFFTFQAFSIPLASIGPNSTPQDVCSLPAPTNFHVEEIGTDYLIAAWTVASPNQGMHRVQVLRQSNNQLLKTVDVPAGQTQVTITDLPVATNFIVKGCELCINGEEGNYVAISQNGIILDLIVKGYTDTENTNSNCQINPGQAYCTLVGGYQNTYFEVYEVNNTSNARRFSVKYSLSGQMAKYEIKAAGQGSSTIRFFCPFTDAYEVDCGEISHVNIKKVVSPGVFEDITKLKCSGQLLTASLNSFTVINSQFVIKRLDLPPGFQDPNPQTIADRNETPSKPFENLFLSPNPFTESISLDFYLPPGEALEAQLFSPSGQKVYAQHLDAGQTSYTLTPSNLPSGLYFLRLESGGEVCTIKMVKSE